MTAYYSGDELYREVPVDPSTNTGNAMLNRAGGRVIEISPTIVLAAGANVSNVFQITGSVRILDQWAEVLAISGGDISAVYSTLYDGTNTVGITADGLDLTGVPVGTFFTKDKVATEPFSMSAADQCRVLETVDAKRVGRPYTATQKNGANTYIRLHATASAEASLQIIIHFEYALINGGSITALI